MRQRVIANRRIAALLGVASALAPRPADAFPGFFVAEEPKRGQPESKAYSEASFVVVMREGTRTVLTIQPSYLGSRESFAMVIPVPAALAKADVKVLPRALTERLEQLTAPRLVEHWERDPCPRDGGAGGERAPSPSSRSHAPREPPRAKAEARAAASEYDVTILGAKESRDLPAWLRANHYAVPEGIAGAVMPYVDAGSRLLVARVDSQKLVFEKIGPLKRAKLSPLRFHYDADDLTLRIRLGLRSSPGVHDLLVAIVARHQRYELANYTTVAIPTNIELSESGMHQFQSLYASLFDRTLAHHPRAVVTEYAWDARSCEPCPVAALRPDELLALGADVLSSTPVERESPLFGSGFVVTRLHARYDAESAREDMVLRAASPIAASGQEAVPAPHNEFQARYAVHHAWPLAVPCDAPVRGQWASSRGDDGRAPRPRVATNLAFAIRDDVALAAMVKDGVPALDLVASGALTQRDADADRSDAGALAEPALRAPSAATKSGCGGCDVGWALGMLGLRFSRRSKGKRE